MPKKAWTRKKSKRGRRSRRQKRHWGAGDTMFDLVGMQAPSPSPSRSLSRSLPSSRVPEPELTGHLKIDQELVSSQKSPPDGYQCPPDTRYISDPIIDADGTKRYCLSMYVDKYFPLYSLEEMMGRTQKYKDQNLEKLRPRDDILDFTYALKQIVGSIPADQDNVKNGGLGLQKQMNNIYLSMVEMRQAPSIFIARIKDTIEIIKNLQDEDDADSKKKYDLYKNIAERLEDLIEQTQWITPYLEEYIPKFLSIY